MQTVGTTTSTTPPFGYAENDGLRLRLTDTWSLDDRESQRKTVELAWLLKQSGRYYGLSQQTPQPAPRMNTNTVKTFIKITMFRFGTMANARCFADQATSPMRIALGEQDRECGEFCI